MNRYRTVRLLEEDVQRIERALKSHPFLDGTKFVRWGNWISYMTGSEILAMAKKSGPRRATELQEQIDAGRDASYLLSDEDEKNAENES